MRQVFLYNFTVNKKYYILNTAQNTQFFSLAYQFVLPYERLCCALMQKILNKDSNVNLVMENDLHGAVALKVVGVFYYTKGNLVLSCLPYQSREVFNVLRSFFLKNRVFCISSFTAYTEFLIKVLDSVGTQCVNEVRNYYLMEFNTGSLCKNTYGYTLRQCSKKDVDELLPMQVSYVTEEVLLKGTQAVPRAERLSLEKSVKAQNIFCLCQNNKIVSKVHISALTEHYAQLGGVYTLKSFRQRGLASCLVNNVSSQLWINGKKAVLFVNVKNTPAIHSYLNAGFNSFGEYKIAYYNI